MLERLLFRTDLSNIELIPLNIGEEDNYNIAKEKGFDTVPVLLFEDGRFLKGSKSLTLDELNKFLLS